MSTHSSSASSITRHSRQAVRAQVSTQTTLNLLGMLRDAADRGTLNGMHLLTMFRHLSTLTRSVDAKEHTETILYFLGHFYAHKALPRKQLLAYRDMISSHYTADADTTVPAGLATFKPKWLNLGIYSPQNDPATKRGMSPLSVSLLHQLTRVAPEDTSSRSLTRELVYTLQSLLGIESLWRQHGDTSQRYRYMNYTTAQRSIVDDLNEVSDVTNITVNRTLATMVNTGELHPAEALLMAGYQPSKTVHDVINHADPDTENRAEASRLALWFALDTREWEVSVRELIEVASSADQDGMPYSLLALMCAQEQEPETGTSGIVNLNRFTNHKQKEHYAAFERISQWNLWKSGVLYRDELKFLEGHHG